MTLVRDLARNWRKIVIDEIDAAGRLSAVRWIFEHHHHSGDGLGRVLEKLDDAGMDYTVESSATERAATEVRELLMVRARRQAAALSTSASEVTSAER